MQVIYFESKPYGLVPNTCNNIWYIEHWYITSNKNIKYKKILLLHYFKLNVPVRSRDLYKIN